VRLYNLTAIDLISADTTIVRALSGRETAL
jgi:hypothetical protein